MMENFGYLVFAAIVCWIIWKVGKEWEDKSIREERDRLENEAKRQKKEKMRAEDPVVVARCPDCGYSWPTGIPHSTFYVSCPKCNAQTYAGP